MHHLRRLVAVAVVLAGVAAPGWAQRGGGARGGGGAHGGFSGGGFSGGSRLSYAASRGVSTGFSSSRLSERVVARSGYPVRPPVYGGRRSWVPSYGYGYPLGYGVTGWFGPDFLDYPDGYTDAGYPQTPQNAYGYAPAAQPYSGSDGSQAGYAAAPAERSPNQDAYRPAYQKTQAQPEPTAEDALTLVYKDGRPQEQIHNYLLSKTTLHVWDGRHREVAVDDLDLVAMVRVNRAAGVDFQLPEAAK